MTEPQSTSDRDWTRLTLLVIACFLTLRLIALFLSGFELSYDEAQYWAWSRNLAFGYFTKPGLIAWLIRGTTEVCGSGVACVRAPAPLLHAASAWFVFLAARRLYDYRIGFWSALAYVSMPAVSLSSLILNTDVPLLFFWCVGLHATVLFVERASLSRALYLAGVVAIGLNAKYAMIYLPASLLVFFLVAADRRPLLRSGATWVALFGGLVGFLPNLIWNAQNGFVTFHHTGDNAGWQAMGFKLGKIFEYLGGQAAIPGPILFAVAVLAAILGWRSTKPVADRLMMWLSLPILIVIGVNAAFAKLHGNWAATAFPALVIFASAVLVDTRWRGLLKLSTAINTTAAVGLAIGTSLVGHVALPQKPTQLHRLLHWSDYGEKLIAAARAAGVRTVVTVGRPMTSETLYELRGSGLDVRPYVASGAAPSDQFEMTIPYDPAKHGPALMVTEVDPATLGIEPERIEPLGALETRIYKARDGRIPIYRIDR
ncbi:glycosyltransferase family 39 protein [Pleomorphomonas sp. JP5]|uniref:ArnT family glycosyltransferase n=1 Tax=Pleomorphomonas sp. JP5 TaxID=2942998 RepID=UPI0020437C2C|nr:glycosyltransferase family 39 protein [Pleomorphomonas sp. JP5]MCM5556432.1 glycosyltransferase family 39 protein [Pleomorphomonas sp. JP5]